MTKTKIIHVLKSVLEINNVEIIKCTLSALIDELESPVRKNVKKN